MSGQKEDDDFGMLAQEEQDKTFRSLPTFAASERREALQAPTHIDIILKIQSLHEEHQIFREDSEIFRTLIKGEINAASARVDAAINLMKENSRHMQANGAQLEKLIESVHALAMRG